MLTGSIEGVDKVIRRLERMERKIEHFEGAIANEVGNWEKRDIHRKPAVVRVRDGSGLATTLFRPMSRARMRRSLLARMRPHYHARFSTRDILRREMINRLIQRINRRVSRELRW